MQEKRLASDANTSVRNAGKKFDNVADEIKHVSKIICLDCLICQTSSNSYGSFIQQRLKHTTEKIHSFEECNESFYCSGDFQWQLKYHFNLENVISHFLHQTIFWHKKRHEDWIPHLCTFCFKSFFSKSEINGHILVHIGNKPHSCSECGKTFASKGNLISYVKIHLDDKDCMFKMQKKSV